MGTRACLLAPFMLHRSCSEVHTKLCQLGLVLASSQPYMADAAEEAAAGYAKVHEQQAKADAPKAQPHREPLAELWRTPKRRRKQAKPLEAGSMPGCAAYLASPIDLTC